VPELDNVPEEEEEEEDIPFVSAQVHAVVDILTMQYGFVPPLPSSSTSPSPIDQVTQKKFLRLIGHTEDDGTMFSTILGSLAVKFAQTLVSKARPTPDSWDLDPLNRRALVHASRLQYLHRVSDSLFVFDFLGHSSVPWKLGVLRATDALFICRLDASFDEYDIARNLVNEGIRFYTFFYLREIPRPPSFNSKSRVLPIRLPGYQFTKEDYERYIQQRAVIFTQPRARSVLLRGGLIWRLGIETLSINDALRGPSVAVTVARHGFSTRHPTLGVQMWDDDLTPDELDLICGAYICYTGMNISVTYCLCGF
jgi:hypothetical protein